MRKQYQITEYGSFTRGVVAEGYKSLPCNVFDVLESFILTNKSKDTDALELLGISARKGIGKIITAKNFVGVIAMKDGTTIEVLPKVSNMEYSEEQAKKLLIEMLKSLKDSPYKSFHSTNIKVEKMDIFEIFIRMFIDEVLGIAKHGFKSDYQRVESNEKYFKGKLIINENIKHNHSHKEMNYVEYDEFNENCPENRLLKSALEYLYTQTTSIKNKTDIKTLKNILSEVDVSDDYEVDFARIVPDRRTKEYANALTWCHVFLQGKSFATYLGSEVAFSLLFPMETLYESYVAKYVKKIFGAEGHSVSVQDRRYYLFDYPRQFQMRPDIVIKRPDGTQIIMDTKWKLLPLGNIGGSISQSDMYQMYAYHKKYTDADRVILIYPLANDAQKDVEMNFKSRDEVEVDIRFVDLMSIKDSIRTLLEETKLGGSVAI